MKRGTSIDRYVVLDRLGAGAMGVVYGAYDPRLDRQVAVKLLHGTPSSTENAEGGVLDEARALAKLNHPNVVVVHDAGQFKETVFITMERVDGETLDAWLSDESRTWQQILAVLLGAGRGLWAAHQGGTVHRDFKPANVMVGLDGVAKVMDFGLAALAGTGGVKRSRPAGTPLYMAPEQYLGDPATFVSDQYAFCLVAYEALAGVHPRAGAKTMGALLESSTRDPQPLSCPGLPATVRAAIVRGLSPQPQKRWPSMEPLLQVCSDALRGRRSRWLGGAAVLGVAAAAWGMSQADEKSACPDPVSVARSLVPLDDQRAVEVALRSFDETYAVARASLVSAGIDDYASRWAEADADACHAQEEQPSARRQHNSANACLARHRDAFVGGVRVLGEAVGVERVRAADFLDKLADPLGCVDPQLSIVGLEEPPAEVADAVAGHRRTLAFLRAEAAVGRWARVVEDAETLLKEVRDLAYPPVVAEALWVLGDAQRNLARIDEAERTLNEAAWLALEQGHRAVALQAAVSLVALRRDLSETDVNQAWARRARRLIRGGTDPSFEAQIEAHMAVALRSIGHYDEAKPHAEAAVAIARRVHGPGDSRFADARQVYATVVYRQGDLDEAMSTVAEVLALRERLLGPRHPSIISTLQLRASILRGEGEFDKAETDLLKAAQLQRSLMGPRTRALAGLLNNLGNVYVEQGRYPKAHAVLDEAISIWEELKHYDSLVYAYTTKAGLARKESEHETSRRWAMQAWETMERMGGPHPRRGYAASEVGAASFRLGNFEDAQRWLDLADAQGTLQGQALRGHLGWKALLASAQGDSAAAAAYAFAATDGSHPLESPWRERIEALAKR